MTDTTHELRAEARAMRREARAAMRRDALRDGWAVAAALAVGYASMWALAAALVALGL